MKYFVVFFLFASAFLLQACGDNHSNSITDNTALEESPTIDGESLFVQYCKQCHLPKKDFIGPALSGVENRWKKREDLYAFIKNPQEVIIRNTYAKDLFEKWNQSPMLPFPQLSRSEIDAILAYCNQADS